MGDYPTDDELKELKELCDYPLRMDELLDFIKSIWWMPDWGYHLSDDVDHITGAKIQRLELHTGGWSGNEEIIGELQNTFFWRFYWHGSRRGGHYYFEIPRKESDDGSAN